MSLPGLDMRQLCPGCKKPASVLGQWMPGNKAFLCRTCIEQYPMPDVLERADHKKAGLIVRREMTPELMAERERMVSMENSLYRLRRGCIYTFNEWSRSSGLPCEALDFTPFRDCPLCVKELRNYTRRQRHEPESLAWLKRSQPRMLTTTHGWVNQLPMPICEVCGQAHDHTYTHVQGYAAKCQACEDEAAVQSFWRCRAIFGGDDPEVILDRIQKSHPGLFERGLLPDRWFELMQEAVSC